MRDRLTDEILFGKLEQGGTVTIDVDGSDSGIAWQSPWLEAGQCATPDGDGYVRGIPAQSEGEHRFTAHAEPPGSNGGTTTNTVNIGAAE